MSGFAKILRGDQGMGAVHKQWGFPLLSTACARQPATSFPKNQGADWLESIDGKRSGWKGGVDESYIWLHYRAAPESNISLSMECPSGLCAVQLILHLCETEAYKGHLCATPLWFEFCRNHRSWIIPAIGRYSVSSDGATQFKAGTLRFSNTQAIYTIQRLASCSNRGVFIHFDGKTVFVNLDNTFHRYFNLMVNCQGSSPPIFAAGMS